MAGCHQRIGASQDRTSGDVTDCDGVNGEKYRGND